MITRTLILVRHPPVDERFTGICYGATDVSLSVTGRAMVPVLAAELAREPITHLVQSGLSRAAAVADHLASLVGIPAVVDRRLRELNFGAWELRPWDDIHAECGDALNGMLTNPSTWRPPDGETVFELRDRVMGWYAGLPATGVIVAVTHGGPIAALRGTLLGCETPEWPQLIPRTGAVVRLPQ